MSIKLNTVFLAGNLVKDPVIRELQGGVKKAELRIAVNSERTGADGSKVERTSFFDIVVWRKQAEIAESYLKKGRGIIVEGRLDYEQWQDKEGNPHSRVCVLCNHFSFLPKASEQGVVPEKTSGDKATSKPMETASFSPLNPVSAANEAVLASGEDDIPF